MHTVKVESRLYPGARWLRENIKEGFSINFGDEDTYIFYNERDAEVFRLHVADLKNQYDRFLSQKDT